MIELPSDPARPDARVKVGDRFHDEMVEHALAVDKYQEERLRPIWEKGVRYWQRYFGDREDKRNEHEQWRAHLAIPHSHSALNSLISALIEIINAADPPIQAVGEGDEDLVPHLVAVRVVDWLEVVDIDVREPHQVPVALGF